MDYHWIGPFAGYHTGDQQPGDEACPPRPDANYDWIDGAWVLNQARASAVVNEENAAVSATRSREDLLAALERSIQANDDQTIINTAFLQLFKGLVS